MKNSPLGILIPEFIGDVKNTHYELVEAYNKLDNESNLGKIHTQWVEEKIIKTQRDTALEGNYKVNKKSYIGYTVPYLEKQYSEFSWFEGLKNFGRDIFFSLNFKEETFE